MKTIEEEIASISQGFQIDTHKMLYKTKADLKNSGNRIICHYMLYRPRVGYTIFSCFFHRKAQSVVSWRKFLVEKSYELLVNVILPKLVESNIPDDRYYFKSFLCWRLANKKDKDPHRK